MLKQMVTAGEFPSVVNGILCAPGTVVTVDTSLFEPGPNLVEMGERPALIPVAVAPLGPTGPNPTVPQQVPPGSLQTADGYASGAHLYVGPGSELLNTPAAEGDAAKADSADWAAFQEWQASRTALAPPLTPVGDPSFNADGMIEGTIPDVVGRLDGLTRDQLEAVQAAENDREVPRQGVKAAIDAALAKL